MSNTGSPIRCAACEFESESDEEQAQCPNCNAAIYQVTVDESVKVCDGYKARVVTGGMSRTKGCYIRSESFPTPQASRGGAMARVDRVYDRVRDCYKEKVVDCETGEVIHEVEEKLERDLLRPKHILRW